MFFIWRGNCLEFLGQMTVWPNNIPGVPGWFDNPQHNAWPLEMLKRELTLCPDGPMGHKSRPMRVHVSCISAWQPIHSGLPCVQLQASAKVLYRFRYCTESHHPIWFFLSKEFGWVTSNSYFLNGWNKSGGMLCAVFVNRNCVTCQASCSEFQEYLKKCESKYARIVNIMITRKFAFVRERFIMMIARLLLGNVITASVE